MAVLGTFYLYAARLGGVFAWFAYCDVVAVVFTGEAPSSVGEEEEGERQQEGSDEQGRHQKSLESSPRAP